jgi:hypothetical protein
MLLATVTLLEAGEETKLVVPQATRRIPHASITNIKQTLSLNKKTNICSVWAVIVCGCHVSRRKYLEPERGV